MTEEAFRSIVHFIRIDDHGPNVIRNLWSLTQEQREHVMGCWLKPERQTVFFRACAGHRWDVAEYCLENCNPDVNVRCDYCKPYSDNDIVHGAFPLWCAAYSGNTELVKLLIKYGVNVNAKTSNGSTALRAACFKDRFEIIKILLAAGADIHVRNNKGATCLMATQDITIMEYLLREGIDINARETAGNMATALHYAISLSDSLCKVQVLVESGADLSIPEKNGLPPYLAAALGAKNDMMDYLLEKNQESESTVFKARVMCAVSLIVEGEETGLQHLRSAYEQKPEGYIGEHASQVESITHMFPAVTIPDTIDEVMEMLTDEKTLQAMVLLIAAHHISIDSDFFIYSLLKFVSLDMYEHRENSMAIGTFVYNTILEKKEWFHENVAHCICMQVRVMGEMMEDTPLCSDIQNELDVLINKVTDHIISATQERKANVFYDDPNNEESATLTSLMIELMYLVNMFIKNFPDSLAIPNLQRLAVTNPQTSEGDTLLHILVDSEQFNDLDPVTITEWDPCLDLGVISYLIEQGFPLDIQNEHGLTPLSSVLTYTREDCEPEEHELNQKAANLLLENGAHLDIRSKFGESALSSCEDYDICPFNYLTLKCLSANAVVMHNVPYRNETLPGEVKSFLALHAPYKGFNEDILHESLD